MSLDKAIKSGKERRTQYGTKGQPFAKAVDDLCRNHGGRRKRKQCIWCLSNRTHSSKVREEKFK